MGIQSMVSHATSRLKRDDTTNSRTLRRLIRRLSSVAKDLENKNNIAKQRKLETIVATIVAEYDDASQSQYSSIPSQIAPIIQAKRREILVRADATLNEIQPPPKGHSEEMKRAISKDAKALVSLLDPLSRASDDVLEEVRLITPDEPSTRQKDPKDLLERKEVQASANASSSQPEGISLEEKAHAKFQKKLALFMQTNRKPPMVIEISAMGEGKEAAVHLIPLNATFWTLTENITNSNGESFLPDIWSKKEDAIRNCVTSSALYFEWQDPKTKVMDAINNDGYLGIESVCKEGEYVVVLVKKGENENGFPIDIPRVRRQATSLHLKEIFPEYTVSQVRQLQLGDDASNVVFDNRSFRHQTNPLFVELCVDAGEDIIDLDTGKNKGKRRAYNI